MSKVLYVSGSLGLGHSGRDLAIVMELRKLRPDIEVTWMADDPARKMIEEAGEKIAPESMQVSYGTKRAEAAARDYSANLVMIGAGMIKDGPSNGEACRKVILREKFDLVVGDEAYDLAISIRKDHNLLNGAPFVFIYDFLGFDAMTSSLKEHFFTYYANRIWYKTMIDPGIIAKKIFIGVPDDVPDSKWGMFMPSRRETGKDMEYVGYILSFDPADYLDGQKAKTDLGYGIDPLIICTVGGTAAGKPLLDLCAQAFPHIKKSIPNARMILVCGPRIEPKEVMRTEGVEVWGYKPELFKHLAACDLAITAAGGTTCLELIGLQKPFIYFPIEQHYEQMMGVAESNRRKGAELMMRYPLTTPEALAKAVVENIGKKVDYVPTPFDGATRAAKIINEMLEKA